MRDISVSVQLWESDYTAGYEGDKRSAQGRSDFDLFDTRGTITPPAVTKHSLWNLFVCVHLHLWLGRRLYLGQYNVFKDVPVCLRVDGQF